MPQVKTLINSSDQKDIKNIVQIYFPDVESIVSVEPEFDTELCNINIRLDITHDKLDKELQEQLKAMCICIEALGEGLLNTEIKCKDCQTYSTYPAILDDFFCLKCYQKTKEPTESSVCHNCQKKYKHNGCRVHLEAEVTDSKDKDHVAIKNLDIHETSIFSWECCSIKCAKIEYNKWLKNLLEHPWTQDYLKSV